MLEYDRIDVSESINTDTTNDLLECIIYHYWYFLKINFIFQPKVFDDCLDMTQKFCQLWWLGDYYYWKNWL